MKIDAQFVGVALGACPSVELFQGHVYKPTDLLPDA
jgi:hypothetical protein